MINSNGMDDFLSLFIGFVPLFGFAGAPLSMTALKFLKMVTKHPEMEDIKTPIALLIPVDFIGESCQITTVGTYL